MSAAESGKPALRCSHSGREVAETVHTRSAYRVDYYALHTGDVEPVTLRADELSPLVTVFKLVRAHNICTCADCYRRPLVQGERERLFRPERDQVDGADAGG